MAAGDLTASTPVLCSGIAALKTAVDLLNLAAATDRLVILPISKSPNQFVVFKVERAA